MAATTERPADPGPSGIFARKPAQDLIADTERKDSQLRKAAGALDLTALGIGAVIGTGIFVVIGEAIALSGPGVIVAFAIAGITCIFSALSYAELASTIPVSGSAYTYAYATLGEVVAFIIGWDLILEYGLSVSAVSVGWGGYLVEFLDGLFGFSLPESIIQPPGDGGVVNVPAVAIVLVITAVLIGGVKASLRSNLVMVVIKLVVLALFIAIGVTAIDGANYEPFAPEGFSGIESAAAIIFFAYIGFDAVSTSSEEAKNPGRDLPIGIVGSLLIATAIYIAVAIVTAGLLPAGELAGSEAPLAIALTDGAGLSWGGTLISFGALVAITSVVLTIFFGQTRIMFSMCRDGLMPRGFGKLSERFRTPVYITLVFGVLIAIIAAFIPLQEIVELVNIGTLFAFVIVNVGLLVLRRTAPDLDRKFKVPFAWVLAPIGAALCIYLMTKLPIATWWRFGIWMVVGLAIYLLYSRHHSRLRRGPPVDPGATNPS